MGHVELAEEVNLESQARAFGMMTGLFQRGDVVLLSGAGLSTESGIPDYRGPRGAARAADDLPGVHREHGGATAVLGAQPPRLAARHRGGPERGTPGDSGTGA